MNILLLGGTGFLGGKLLNRLSSSNHSIICLVRKTSVISIQSPNIRYVDIDTVNYDSLGIVDCFINLSCTYEASGVDKNIIYDSNLFTPISVANNLLRCGLKRIISIGTGLPDEFNNYSYSKKLYSKYGSFLCNSSCLDAFFDLKLEYFFDVDEPTTRFVSNTINKLLNNDVVELRSGNQIRDFVDTNSVLDVICALLSHNYLGYIEIPVGSGHSISIRDFVYFMKDYLKSQSTIVFNSIPNRNNEPNTFADLKTIRELKLPIPSDWADTILGVMDYKRNCME